MAEPSPVQRRLAAILAADVAGYSRLMGADEEGTLARLKALRAELIDPGLAEHHGRIVKTTGDGLLVEFASVVDAMRCAVGWQSAMADRAQPAETRIEFRIGVNLGDIIIDGDDIFGDGVNIAARLEAMAEPGGICISRTVLTQTRGKLDFPVEDLGEQALKNSGSTAGSGTAVSSASTLDPGFAAPHAALALTLVIESAIFRPNDEGQAPIPRAIECARRSIALDPTEAAGHCALASALLRMGRHNGAIAEADLAVSLEPNSAWGHHFQGFTRAWGGRPSEAIAPLETAIRLSPFDPLMTFFLHGLSRAHYYTGNYPAALAVARQICQNYPNHHPAHRTLIAALGQTGQAAEAQRVMAEAQQRFGVDFHTRYMGAPLDTRREDREHLAEGYRKAGVLD
jgi:Flp pilus assembly protein TadD